MSGTTVIRNADWVVAWDPETERHRYLRDADVAFAEGRIVHVGGGFDGPAAMELDGHARMVMPGLVNVHCHPGDEALAKGLFDDTGSPALYGHALYELSGLIEPDPAAIAASAQMTLAELLRSGVTTVVDLSAPWEGWLDLLARSGLRAYAGPGFRQARWDASSGRRLEYVWDRAGGRQRFERALEIVDAAIAHPSGRLGAVIAPAQIDTCDEALLREAHAAAAARDIPLTLHAAQTMVEFDELMRRHGQSAPQWLERIGILDRRVTLGHGIFLDHHSWTRLRSADDLALLAERGTSIAHCPVTFARSGVTLESVGGYRRAGVNVALGTDSYPANMLEEMRQAVYCARIAAKTVFDTSVGEIFEVATIGGARALGRTDIGRLAPGSPADIVTVDLTHPAMQPVHDPLRSLVLAAAERAVCDVFVDGEPIVTAGRVLTIDLEAAAAAVHEGQRRAIEHCGRERLLEAAKRCLP